ncbi:MAG: hypothetical protein U9O65_08215 [Thermotogota bacterium]|nr:hypothetical protein [Thermotogota bacterium]
MIKKAIFVYFSLIMIMGIITTNFALTVDAPGFDLGVLSIEDPTEFNNKTFWIDVIKETPINILVDYEMFAKTATGELISITHYIEQGGS